MNKSESKYYNTACLMNDALILLLAKKDFEYITVKEICEKAGVNRSTFYLHYDTMNDLLDETARYVLKNFYLQMQESDDFNMSEGDNGIKKHISESSLDELYLVTPKYLEPYLHFIKNNKNLYHTVIQHIDLFKWEDTYNYMYNHIFSPILDKYGTPENVKPYMVSFFIQGLMAVICQWIKTDCAESIPELMDIIKTCMNR